MEDFKRYNEIVGIIENCMNDIFEMFDSYQEDYGMNYTNVLLFLLLNFVNSAV